MYDNYLKNLIVIENYNLGTFVIVVKLDLS
jgi:hypothetical protein